MTFVRPSQVGDFGATNLVPYLLSVPSLSTPNNRFWRQGWSLIFSCQCQLLGLASQRKVVFHKSARQSLSSLTTREQHMKQGDGCWGRDPMWLPPLLVPSLLLEQNMAAYTLSSCENTS